MNLSIFMNEGLPVFIIFSAIFVPLQIVNFHTGNLIGTVAYFLPALLLIYVMLRHIHIALGKQKAKLSARSRIDQLLRQVSTPKESCEWFNRTFEWFWMGYLRKIIESNMKPIVTTQLIDNKPKFLKALTLRKFHLGDAPPQVSNMCTMSGGDHGVNIWQAGLNFQSSNLCIELMAEAFLLKGRPLLITITHIGLEGPLRIVPFVEKEAFMFAFRTKPVVTLDFKVTTAAGMSLIVSEIPGLAEFLKSFCENLANNLFTTPNYMCNSLVSQLMSNKLNQINVSRGVVRIRFDFVEGLKKDRTYIIKTCFGSETTRDTDPFTIASDAESNHYCIKQHVDLNFVKNGGRLYIRILQMKSSTSSSMSPSNLTTVASTKICFAVDVDGSLYAYGFSRGPFFERGVSSVHGDPCSNSLSLSVQSEEDTGILICPTLLIVEEQHKDDMLSSGELERRGTTHTIELQIIEAKNLVPRDATGKSDPYCKIDYGPRSEFTEVKRKTLMPQWGEYFEFEERWESKYRFISLRIYDWDGTTNDDPMGDIMIPLDGLYVDTHLDLWLPLNNVESGEIHVRIGLRSGPPTRIYSKAVRARSNVIEGDDVIEVCIKEGKSLASRDRGNKTDGFIELTYGSRLKHKTHVIKKTLNPRWEYTVLCKVIPGEPMNFACFDKDFSGKEQIGRFQIRNEWIMNNPGKELDMWYQLSDVESGEIHIVTKFHKGIMLPTNSTLLASQKPKMTLNLQRQRTMKLCNSANPSPEKISSKDILDCEDVVFSDKQPRDQEGITKAQPLPPKKAMTIFGARQTENRELELKAKVEELETLLQEQEKRHKRQEAKLTREQDMVLSKVKLLEDALSRLPLEKLKKNKTISSK